MNLLAIDQGNSRTKFWLKTTADDKKWSCVSGEEDACNELLNLPANLHIALSSVNTTNRDRLIPLLKFSKLTVLSAMSPLPIKIEYNDATHLGIDRVLAAIGAMLISGSPVITVLAGTATVVDMVDAKGVYRGGFIAPGVLSSAEGLYNAAPALPHPVLSPDITVPGTTPEECVKAGIIANAAGGVKEMISLLANHNNIIISGGWGKLIAKHINREANYVDDLVLRGVMHTLECICNDTGGV